MEDVVVLQIGKLIRNNDWLLFLKRLLSHTFRRNKCHDLGSRRYLHFSHEFSPCKYDFCPISNAAHETLCTIRCDYGKWVFFSPILPDPMMCIDIRKFRLVFHVNNAMATSACLRQFVAFCYGCCFVVVCFFVIASAVVNAKLCEHMMKSKLSLWAWEMDETKWACIMSWCVSYSRIKSQHEISQWARISYGFETAKTDTQWNQLKSTLIGAYFWRALRFNWPKRFCIVHHVTRCY